MGQEWFQTAELRLGLRVLHNLQASGYRGGALGFSMWWVGASPLNPLCRSYVLKMQSINAEKLRRRLSRLAREDEATGQRQDLSQEVASPDQADLLSTWISVALMDREPLQRLREMLAAMVPGFDLTPEELEPLFGAFAASSMGVSAQEVDSPVGYLAERVRPLSDSTSTQDDVFMARFLELYETPKMFSILVRSIELASPAAFARARAAIRRSQFMKPWLRRIIADDAATLSRMSRRKLQRQGPWLKPASAYRAGLVGLVLGSEGMFAELGFPEMFQRVVNG